MGKPVFKASRRDCYLFDPTKLKLVTDEKHHLYDPRVKLPVDEALVESIMFDAQGVIEPVVVTKDGEDAVVVDGRQRVKAAVEANKRLKKAGEVQVKVPCIVRRGTAKHLAGTAVMANELRRDDDILVRAKKATNLSNYGYTEEEIAIMFGVTKQTILNWLAIGSLDKTVKSAIKDGKIPASHAMRLARVPKDEQPQIMNEYLEENETVSPNEKPRQKKRNKNSPLHVDKVRSKKECKILLDALGEEHIFVPAIKWFLGEDIDLTDSKYDQFDIKW
jgi:ParB family chromosome partitioning protein